MNLLRLLLPVFFSLPLLRLAAQEAPSVEATLESSMVVVGEETYLTLWTQGVTIIDWPDPPPEVAPLALKRDSKRRFQINGYIRDGFRYRLMAFEPGVFPIPSFVFRTSSGVVRSEPLVLRAFPVADLSTHGIKIAGSVSPYLTGIFLEKPNPYVGEMQDVEAKLYLSQAPPNRLKLADGKVIQLAKDGLAAWRFTTQPEETGFFDYDGQRFQAYTYRSSVNALREGLLTLGPGESEAVLYQRTRPFVHSLQFPSVDLQVRPLPDGAPEGFAGAVGNFTMEIRPLNREIETGDTITVEVDISGSGNIDQFPGPSLMAEQDQWKTFEMVAKPGGSERRSSSGTVQFSQVIRPLGKPVALPPYRFAFFDPAKEQYGMLESPAIPITVSGSVESGSTQERSTAFLTPGTHPLRTFPVQSIIPLWSWQLIPASLVLVLLGGEVRRRLLGRKLARQPTQEFDRIVAQVEELANDERAFYREAARVATEWRGGEEFDELFQKRDEICFRPGADLVPVAPAEKKRIVKLLRSLTPLIIVGLVTLLQLNPLQALPDEPALAKEEILRAMEDQPVREHFYNLAICEKALGNNGLAVLWAYRFELQGGEADDLLADLPGSRRLDRKWLDWISIIPKPIYLQIGIAGLWGLLLLILVAKLYHRKRRRGLITFLSLSSPAALLIGGAAWLLYPEDISFEPLENLSVVTGTGALLSQPFEGGKAMIDSLEGSLCKTGATRAGWTYLTLPGGLSGWIGEGSVTAIRR